ncbi:MAG: membrane integrity-associated transporter subunit PqiC [Paraburkholderia sp.]|uniref:PqiC family protein n=1 Tax=Paraburkholderia sp. TaxID=1926495 RepID=UPI0011FB9638|nr:PqiC family protein [Paraburkholderia sp.]TAM08118.1 MAG: membrane integrity-associated transporter subunit PqiC [Paraburkholderia sp.]TAM31728.1 MAG: membrane integrity-associated transporter subunit PqiC [Paraburkholderia sp.]
MTFDRLPPRHAGRTGRRAGIATVTKVATVAAIATHAARAAALAAAAATALLAGCASPPSHFYTLSPSDDAAPAATSVTAGNPAWLIELAPVNVPPQVAKPQFVVQTDATRVLVLEQRRWASMPGDEIRRALSGDLTQQLHSIDVYGSPHPEGVPVYRVSVNVQRFESWPGSHALVDAVWSVRSLTTQTVMTCRSVLNEPVGDGYDALVTGHRRAVAALSTAIASGVRALAAQTQTQAQTQAQTQSKSAPGGAKHTSRAQPAALIPCPATAPAAAAGSSTSSAAPGTTPG